VVPEKQGLKRERWISKPQDIWGISGGSRKTRIETQNESKDESKPKGISGGSRKTRIETGPGIGFE